VAGLQLLGFFTACYAIVLLAATGFQELFLVGRGPRGMYACTGMML
jgi:hypothetical protein